jgi:hypothetical protein
MSEQDHTIFIHTPIMPSGKDLGGTLDWATKSPASCRAILPDSGNIRLVRDSPFRGKESRLSTSLRPQTLSIVVLKPYNIQA